LYKKKRFEIKVALKERISEKEFGKRRLKF
jgi:hypothetical protein